MNTVGGTSSTVVDDTVIVVMVIVSSRSETTVLFIGVGDVIVITDVEAERGWVDVAVTP